jgi:L-2-hydroxycarboxylate dehydrogenase (NAD+)
VLSEGEPVASLTVKQVHELATQALVGQGFGHDLASEIAEEFVVAELMGVKSHGLGKLVSLNIGDLDAIPNIIDRGALISVDGNGSSGFVLFRKLGDLLIEKCASHGIAAAFARNYSRYSSLHPYTSRIARAGFVAMLANTAGPPAVAPYGSVDPITGTNPICFSFPRVGGREQVFDFATSHVVWGAVRQAAIEGQALPCDSFFNAAGRITTAPAEVNAVRAFGGSKGWALNLAIEILAGIMAGGKVGIECKSEFDCGAIFLAFDPAATGSESSQFAQSLDRLLTGIRATRPENSAAPVRVPGDRGRSSVSLNANGHERLELAGQLIEMMQRMSRGESVTDLASNQLFN